MLEVFSIYSPTVHWHHQIWYPKSIWSKYIPKPLSLEWLLKKGLEVKIRLPSTNESPTTGLARLVSN